MKKFSTDGPDRYSSKTARCQQQDRRSTSLTYRALCIIDASTNELNNVRMLADRNQNIQLRDEIPVGLPWHRQDLSKCGKSSTCMPGVSDFFNIFAATVCPRRIAMKIEPIAPSAIFRFNENSSFRTTQLPDRHCEQERSKLSRP